MLNQFRKVDLQIDFLIMSTIYNDFDYATYGISEDGLVACLMTNKKAWMTVGKVDDGKKYPIRIIRAAKNLVKTKHLRYNPTSRRYYMNIGFEEKLLEIVGQLYEALELEYFVKTPLLNNDKTTIEKAFETNQIVVDIIAGVDNKNVLMLDTDQIKLLAKLGMIHGMIMIPV